MKRLFGIVIVLALVLSFSLVATTPVVATNGPVYNETQDTYHATIQDAIDAAQEGDVIFVEAGYQVTLDSRIRVEESITLTTDADDPAHLIYLGNDTSSVIGIHAEHVTVENFILERRNGDRGSEAISVRESGATIRRTHIFGDALHGIHVTDGYPSAYGDDMPYEITIKDNLIQMEPQGGDWPYAYAIGISAYGASEWGKVTIEGNTIEGLEESELDLGVDVFDSTLVSSGATLNVDITNNTISARFGVRLVELEEAGTFNVQITENTIIGNQRGVQARVWDLSGVTVRCNTIAENTVWGAQSVYDDTLDARQNWWGDASGPYHPDTNPDGTGNGVTDNVLFDPWIGATQDVETDTETGTAYFTASHGCVADIQALAEIPPGAPSGVSFPHGMFEFSISCLTPGQSVTVTIELPEDVPVGYVWWKYQDGEWYSLPNETDDGDNIMTIRLTDGGLGDADGVADGFISDPGGPGNPEPDPVVVGWEGSPVNKAAVVAPWIALFTAIMAGATLLVMRPRRAQI